MGSKENQAMKPCPFCGKGDAEIQRRYGITNLIYYIRCNVCEADGPRSITPERAAELWNERDPDNA